MFESIINFFKKIGKQDKNQVHSKDAAKERLHLVLMQDRANVSADFLDLMKQEIIEVIKKYIDVDESEIDVRLANKTNEDGTTGAPALYANIPIISIKEEAKKNLGTQASISSAECDKTVKNTEDGEKKQSDKEKTENIGKENTSPEEKKDDKKEENVNTEKKEDILENKEEEAQENIETNIAHSDENNQ